MAPHVLICGAGVVGVTLAQALKKRNISFTLFERDESAMARGQGWGITIHWALESLESCLPQALFARLHDVQVDPSCRDEGNFLFLNGKTAQVQARIPPTRRVRVKRQGFRKLLMDGLNVQWGKRLTDITASPAGGVTAHFADGTSADGTLLVGADGSNSRTRQIVCPDAHTLAPVPVRLLGCAVRLTSEQTAPLREVDPLLFQALQPETGVFFWFSVIDPPTESDDHYTVQLNISWLDPSPGSASFPSSTSPPFLSSPVSRLQEMKSRASAFADPIRTAVLLIPPDTPVQEIVVADWPCLPWENFSGRVTLAGDAAHAMTMYRGEAANHGILDAAELARALAENADQAAAVDAYERNMRQRAQPAVGLSRRACLDAHNWASVEEGRAAVLGRRSGTVEGVCEQI